MHGGTSGGRHRAQGVEVDKASAHFSWHESQHLAHPLKAVLLSNPLRKPKECEEKRRAIHLKET